MREFELEIDHFQFFAGDSVHGYRADTSALWDNATSDQRVATMKNLIAVTAGRYGGRVTVQFTTHTGRPTLSSAEWDRLAECDLEILSGEILFWSPELDESKCKRFTLEPGRYRALIAVSRTTHANGQIGAHEDEVYHVAIWMSA